MYATLVERPKRATPAPKPLPPLSPLAEVRRHLFEVFFDDKPGTADEKFAAAYRFIDHEAPEEFSHQLQTLPGQLRAVYTSSRPVRR